MTEAATAATTHGAKRLSGRKSAPVRYSGRCHTPHARPRTTLAPSALRPRCRCGSANPRHPSSSPPALPGKIENRNRKMAPGIVPVTSGASPPSSMLTPTAASASIDSRTIAAHQPRPTRQIRSRRSTVRTPPLPCSTATSTIATAEGTRDPRSNGTKARPVGEPSPATTSGSHSAQEIRYARTKKLASGYCWTRLERRDVVDRVPVCRSSWRTTVCICVRSFSCGAIHARSPEYEREAGKLADPGCGFLVFVARQGAHLEEHGEHARRLVPVRGKGEPAEDAGDVLLDVAERDHQLVRDPVVRRRSAISSSTSRSRGVNSTSGSSLRRLDTNVETPIGSIAEPPFATRRTAPPLQQSQRAALSRMPRCSRRSRKAIETERYPPGLGG